MFFQFGVETLLKHITEKSKLIDINRQDEIKSRINGDFHQSNWRPKPP